METFYKKNDIGVNIEYTVVGTYDDEGTKYVIYTDFVEDGTYPINLRLFVGRKENDQVIDIDEDKKEYILNEMSQLIGEKLGA